MLLTLYAPYLMRVYVSVSGALVSLAACPAGKKRSLKVFQCGKFDE